MWCPRPRRGCRSRVGWDGLDRLSPARYDGTKLSGAFLLAQGLSLTLTGDYVGRLVRLRGD